MVKANAAALQGLTMLNNVGAHELPHDRSDFRVWRPKVVLALGWVSIVAAVSFAAGYHFGAARQERRLLDEFIVNAASLGILDYDRLVELADSTPLGQNEGIEP